MAHGDMYGLLKGFARENRKNQTEAESVMWEYLRRRFVGHKFYRQYIIGDFIVDFLCEDDGLIIEIDGGYHSEYNQLQKDEHRDEILKNAGFSVIRFSNEEVLMDIDNTIRRVERFFEEGIIETTVKEN